MQEYLVIQVLMLCWDLVSDTSREITSGILVGSFITLYATTIWGLGMLVRLVESIEPEFSL